MHLIKVTNDNNEIKYTFHNLHTAAGLLHGYIQIDAIYYSIFCLSPWRMLLIYMLKIIFLLYKQFCLPNLFGESVTKVTVSTVGNQYITWPVGLAYFQTVFRTPFDI